jgi:hypothetical protein
VFKRIGRKARKNTSRRVVEKFAERAEYTGLRFTQGPTDPHPVRRPDRAGRPRGVEEYADNCLDDELRQLLSRYSVADIAHRAQLRRAAARQRQGLARPAGQGGRPVRARTVPEAVPYEHNGERIAHGQCWMQTGSDIFLGWTTRPRTAPVRQFAGHEGHYRPGPDIPTTESPSG